MNPFQPIKWLDAAQYVYTEYLSRPYTAPEINHDWQYEHSGITIPRPNHGLVHTLRTAAYVSFVVHSYNLFNQPPLTNTDVEDIQLTLLFYVTCRENEASFGQNGYQRYRQASADAFERYVRDRNLQGFNDEKITFYKNGILDPYTRSPPQYIIIRICHDIDLARCYSKRKYRLKITEASHHVHLFSKALASFAKMCIQKTGDRLMGKSNYNGSVFVECSRNVEITLKKIGTVFQLYHYIFSPLINPAPFPQNCRIPVPKSPWMISPTVFERIQTFGGGQYKKCELLPTDPEAAFVTRLFLQQKPPNYGIRKIYCIHNSDQKEVFERGLKIIESEALNPVYAPTGKDESPRYERMLVIQRWEQATSLYKVHVKGIDRTDKLKKVKILPLWHGSSQEKCHSICASGFTSFGKHHYFNPAAAQGANNNTDIGFFGSGIYFTDSARYASMYSNGHILLSWVSMREPYPVVNDVAHPAKGSDMRKLEGHGHYINYNAHLIPVASIKPHNPKCLLYYPCFQNQIPAWNELVVFDKMQTLPRFWIELGLDTPEHPIGNSFPLNLDSFHSQEDHSKLNPSWINSHPHVSLNEIGLTNYLLLERFLELNGPQLTCLNLRIFCDMTTIQFERIIYLCPNLEIFIIKDKGDISSFSSIAKLKRLNKVHFSIGDHDLLKCLSLLKLSELRIDSIWTNIDTIDFRFLKSMPLSILKINFSGLPIQCLEYLKGKQIKEISLDFSKPFKTKHLEILHDMPLTTLEVYGNVTDDMIKYFNISTLKKLSFNSCENLIGHGLQHLHGVLLNSITFQSCTKLVNEGIRHLRAMPLTDVNFSCCSCLTDEAIEHLRGKKIKCLRIGSYAFSEKDNFSSRCLESLRGCPIEKIELQSFTLNREADYEILRSFPLKEVSCFSGSDELCEVLKGKYITSLMFWSCEGLTDRGLEFLKDCPIKELYLSRCGSITDNGLIHLQRMPLKSLTLMNFSDLGPLTGRSLVHLRGKALKDISLDIANLEDVDLANLRGMPLQHVSFYNGLRLTNNALEHLRGMPLISNSFVSCPGITKNQIQILKFEF